jgi:hypothetical protein
MTGRRVAILGFALSWLSSISALVVCTVALRRRDPAAKGWVTAGMVSAVVQLLGLAGAVHAGAGFATEPMSAGDVALNVVGPLLLGRGYR